MKSSNPHSAQSLLPFSFPTRLRAVGHSQRSGPRSSSLVRFSSTTLSISFATVRFEVIVVHPLAQPYKNTERLIAVSRSATFFATAGRPSRRTSSFATTLIGSRHSFGTSCSETSANALTNSSLVLFPSSSPSPINNRVLTLSASVPIRSTISRIRVAASAVQTRSRLPMAGHRLEGRTGSLASRSIWRLMARWNQGSGSMAPWLRSETRARRMVQSMLRVGVKVEEGLGRREWKVACRGCVKPLTEMEVGERGASAAAGTVSVGGSRSFWHCTIAPVLLIPSMMSSTSGTSPSLIFGNTNRTWGCLYLTRTAIDALLKSSASFTNPTASSTPLPSLASSPARSDPDEDPASSHPAFALSNNSLVSVTVDTLTHSSPFCATISTSALRRRECPFPFRVPLSGAGSRSQ